MRKMLFALLALLAPISPIFPDSELPPSHEESQSLMPTLFAQIRDCIQANEEFPNKAELLALLEQIQNDGFVVETGSDDLRIKYVALQGIIEHVLACAQGCGEIDQLTGIIHTPTIATPFCVKPEGPIEGVLDASIRNDQSKRLTVRTRAEILRDYLTKGGMVCVAYPHSGTTKRTPEQLQIYRDELKNFPHNLFDCPLKCEEIDPDMVGATHLFRSPQNELFIFSIKARQAIDIQPNAEWGIWFGSTAENRAIRHRMHLILRYLEPYADKDHPNILKKLS